MGVRCRKSQWALPSLANGTDPMASGHWWTRLVMFSLFLNRPPHPFFSQCLEVAETYISLSVFLIVVFLYGFSFFSLSLSLFLQSTQLIRPPSEQIKAQGHATSSLHPKQTCYFRLIFSKELHQNTHMLFDIDTVCDLRQIRFQWFYDWMKLNKQTDFCVFLVLADQFHIMFTLVLNWVSHYSENKNNLLFINHSFHVAPLKLSIHHPWVNFKDSSPPSSRSPSAKYFDVEEIQFMVHFCSASIHCPVSDSPWNQGCTEDEVAFRLFFSRSWPLSPCPLRSVAPPTPHHHFSSLVPCLLYYWRMSCAGVFIHVSEQLRRMHCMCVCVAGGSSCTSVGCISLSQGGAGVVFHHQEKVSPI